MEANEDILIENEDVIGTWATDSERGVDGHFTPRPQEHRLHRGFNLELITDRGDSFTERNPIPASTLQLLCYLRSYVSSPCKVEVLCMQNSDFNVFLWAYLLNVFLQSIPCYYLYIFLGSYAPENHLFLSKMIPLFYGFNWIFTAAGFLDLLVVNDMCTILLQYIVTGMSWDHPWARCSAAYKNYTLYNGTTVTLQCLEMKNFTNLVAGEEPQLVKPIGYTKNGKSFQLAQIMFFQTQWNKYTNGYFGWHRMYCIVLWSLLPFFNRKLYRVSLWKAQHISHWAMNGIFAIIAVNLSYTTQLETDQFSCDDPMEVSIREACTLNTISMLSDSVSAPPLLHWLSSRRNEDLKPTRDSAVITINNAVYFIFRGLVRNRLRVYCNNLIGVPMYASANNRLTLFYTLPIYFSSFELGHIWIVITFIMIFINELFTWIITFQCLLEVIVWEWNGLQRISVAVFVCAAGIFVNIIADEHCKLFLYVISKIVPALCEILVIYFVYPFGRLLDDIHFHFGIQASTLQTMILRAMPIYYGWKTYRIVKTLTAVFKDRGREGDMAVVTMVTWTLILVPLICGACYAFYKEVYEKKKPYSQLIVPAPNFGPTNFVTRQLRKIFDSRDYIDSMAPRVLSRHLMQKTESRVYKIGIRYDSPVCWRSVAVQAHSYARPTYDLNLRRKSKQSSKMDLRSKEL